MGVGDPVDPEGGDVPPSDLELLDRIREGEAEAYDELYRRHAAAVRRYARSCCRDADTADDLTNEVFAATLQAVRSGAGPRAAVRPYLMTSVRRVAADWARTARREHLVEDFADFALAVATADPVSRPDVRTMREAEASMAVQAFRSLPERWQAVLWHTMVEEAPLREVAPLLGLTPNAAAQLAHRAREGLREAYLAAHVNTAEPRGSECERYAKHLGSYARGKLRARLLPGMRGHLAGCDACTRAALELQDLNEQIRSLLPLVVLGWLAAGWSVKWVAFLSGAGGAAGAGAAAAAGGAGAGAGAAAGAGGGSAAGGAGAGAAAEGLSAPAKVGLAAGVVASAVAAALALALMGGEPPEEVARPPAETTRPTPSPEPSRTTSQPPAATPEERPTGGTSRSPSRPTPEESAEPTPEPSRQPTPTPTPTSQQPRPPATLPPAPYEVSGLRFDVAGGDGDEPVIALSESGPVRQRDGLTIGGERYDHGITVQAPSSVTIELNRPCRAYRAFAGIDDMTEDIGAAVFRIYGDGQELWRSSVVEAGDPAVPVEVPLTGFDALQLVVEPDEDTPLSEITQGNWADSEIDCR
ncbi:sigma-70 family RNA polymerase sigma factor [Streptomyces sp. 4N509B]|uniref:sigma-70 family RNA polymerase sigma factor n=1 Tax=Streptomyces sp. 4N509B TaxID=3457413 RepID=UPI003FD18F95